MKRLVVTADDFGLSPGVVSGIVRAHERGIVTATSLMVNAPAAEAAYAAARLVPSLDVGLHFALTFGTPLGPARRVARLLDGEGRFRRTSEAHEMATAGEVRDELRAQIRALADGLGRPPAHIDGHHHVHLHPGILLAVVEEAGRLGIPVRSTDEAVRRRLRREGIRTCDVFVGEFYGADNATEEALLGILESLPEGTSELMCHPADEDDVLSSLSGYVDPRREELKVLCSPRVIDAVTRLGIELVPTSRL